MFDLWFLVHVALTLLLFCILVMLYRAYSRIAIRETSASSDISRRVAETIALLTPFGAPRNDGVKIKALIWLSRLVILLSVILSLADVFLSRS